jgi:hypothetical protein
MLIVSNVLFKAFYTYYHSLQNHSELSMEVQPYNPSTGEAEVGLGYYRVSSESPRTI